MESAYFKDFIYLYLERGKAGEKEREGNINVCLPLVGPTGDRASNPGVYPDWKLNRDPILHSLLLSTLSHTSQGSY